MATAGKNNAAVAALIDLWAAKIHEDLPIPAIVVCGEQSSGKSSLLEAICTLKFPAADCMCTRFATRITTEFSEDSQELTMAIEPDIRRSEADQHALITWAQAQPPRTDLNDFGTMITEAGRRMGSDQTVGFLRDTLLIHAKSPRMVMFTIIDLPGMIQSTKHGQNKEDITHIRELVSKYMADDSMIILAVVSGGNDPENQAVLELVEEYDPQGLRTIGVLTKPDLAESRPQVLETCLQYLLGHSESHNWSLGWHLVKNRDDKSKSQTLSQRDVAEAKYLAQEPWKQVPAERKGGHNLNKRLAQIQEDAFIAAVPRIVLDLEAKVVALRNQLQDFACCVPGVTDPWADFQERLMQVQIQLLTSLKKYRKGGLASGVEQVAKDFSTIVHTHGHFYEFDQKTLVSTLPVAFPPLSNSFEWSREPVEALTILQERAVTMVESHEADFGQLLPEVYNILFQIQTEKWEDLILQYAKHIGMNFEEQLEKICKDVFPGIIAKQIAELLCATYTAELIDNIQTVSKELLAPTEPAGTSKIQAVEKAWQVQLQDLLENSIRTAFSSQFGSPVKKDLSSVLDKLKVQEFNMSGFVVRQAIGVMQVMYLERVEEMKAVCSAKSMKEVLARRFAEFPTEVYHAVTKEQIYGIYGARDESCPAGLELRTKIALYQANLDRLRAL